MSKVYEVEKILDKSFSNGKIKYLIKWVGYPKEESTWEPLENLSNILEMITDYEVGNTSKGNSGSHSTNAIDEYSPPTPKK